MAQYTAQQLVSASNATYVTNTSGLVTAADVRTLNDSWISSSALLSGSNTFIGNQIVNGYISASGNVYGANLTGSTIPTGSFITTGSIELNQSITGSLTITGSSLVSGSFYIKDGQIWMTGSQNGTPGAPSINIQTKNGSGLYDEFIIIDGTAFNLQRTNGVDFDHQAFISSDTFGINDNITGDANFNSLYGISVLSNTGQIGITQNMDNIAGGGITTPGLWGGDGSNTSIPLIYIQDSTNYTDGRLTFVTPISASAGFTASLQEGYVWAGGAGNVSKLVATSSFGTTINTGSFATTGSNTFTGNQIISGSVTFGNGFNITSAYGAVTTFQAANTIQYITEPPAGPGGINDIKFYNRVSGSQIQFINERAGAGNNIQFTGGSSRFDLSSVSGSTGKLVINAVGGIDASNSTFTASLANGYTWVGNGAGIAKAVSTSSFATTINTGSFLTTGSIGIFQTAYGGITFNSGSNQTQIGAGVIELKSSGKQNGINFSGRNNTFFQADGDFFFQNHIGSTGSGSLNFNVASSSMNFALNAYGVNDKAISLTSVSASINLTQQSVNGNGNGDINITSNPFFGTTNDTASLQITTANGYYAPSVNIFGQYPGINIETDSIRWSEGGVFAGFQVIDNGNNYATIFGAAANSYTPEYGPETVGWIGGGGNNPNDSNTAIIMRTGSADLEVFKPMVNNYDVTIQNTAQLVLSHVSQSLNFANDTAAAAGGVPLGGVYRNGNFIMIRLT